MSDCFSVRQVILPDMDKIDLGRSEKGSRVPATEELKEQSRKGGKRN